MRGSVFSRSVDSLAVKLRRIDRRTIAPRGPTETIAAPRALARHNIFFRKWANIAIDQTDRIIPGLERLLARARKDLGIREDSVIRIDAPAESEFVTAVFDRVSIRYGKIEKRERKESRGTVTTTDDVVDVSNKGAVNRQLTAQIAADATIPNVVTPILISRERGMTGGARKKWIDHSLSLIVDKGGPRGPPIPTQHFREAKKIINLGVRRNTVWTEVAKELRQLNGISRRRADLIGHDQVNKHNARMTETRHRSMGIQTYFWTTQRDQKVRDEHREREGVEFANNAPPPDGHPGIPVGCRCFRTPNLHRALGLPFEPPSRKFSVTGDPVVNARSLARGAREKASRNFRNAERQLKVARTRAANAPRGKKTAAEERARKAQTKVNGLDRRLTKAREQVERVGG